MRAREFLIEYIVVTQDQLDARLKKERHQMQMPVKTLVQAAELADPTQKRNTSIGFLPGGPTWGVHHA